MSPVSDCSIGYCCRVGTTPFACLKFHDLGVEKLEQSTGTGTLAQVYDACFFLVMPTVLYPFFFITNFEQENKFLTLRLHYQLLQA